MKVPVFPNSLLWLWAVRPVTKPKKKECVKYWDVALVIYISIRLVSLYLIHLSTSGCCHSLIYKYS